jgi:hypothetical protein
MKRSITVLIAFVTILFIVNACYYDNEEALYPSLSSECDTLNVTFYGKISPLLSNSCLSCHSNTTAAAAGNNIKLENYADVKTRLSSVSGSINHTGNYSPMPKNGAKLNNCLIKQFDIWMAAGAPEN